MERLRRNAIRPQADDIAGYSTDGKANGTAMIVNSLSRFFNLPLKEWYPEEIPRPAKSMVVINGKGKHEEDIIREAVQHTYNIAEDDARLRFSPKDFEKQRGDYPSRREFGAYTVRLNGGGRNAVKMLKELGFIVE